LKLFQEAGIERLRAKSIALTGFLEQLVRRLEPSIQLVTPRDPNSRGCQLSVRIAGSPSHGRRVFDRLTELGAICDWRDPDIIRVAPIPLYNQFEEAFTFSERLAQVLCESS
jgi:kynureninase